MGPRLYIQSMNIATQVSTSRGRLKWTQEYLAERAGISHRTVQRIEAGHNVQSSALDAVASALGMSLIHHPTPTQEQK